MATADQQNYIKDLILQKFRDFKSFKSWLGSTGIVRTNGQIFSRSISLFELTNRITVPQASAIIDELQTLDDVPYKESYDPEVIEKTGKIINQIKKEIAAWNFPQS